MVNRVGVIGYPLGHSLSPIIQQSAIDYCGLSATYEKWEVHSYEISNLLTWMRKTPSVWGANVTVPHKEVLIDLLDELEPDARRTGAVNTIVVRDGRLIGHNTDTKGFLHALSRDTFFDPEGSRVLLLGAGGASKAAIMALIQAKAAHVTIANRTVARARELADKAAANGLLAKAIHLDDNVLKELKSISHWDLIVNTTPMGMRYSGLEHQNPMGAELIPAHALVFDLVYNPRITPLLEAAQAAGALILPGLAMLVYQGAEAFKLWTGVEPPLEIMMAAGQKALGNPMEG